MSNLNDRHHCALIAAIIGAVGGIAQAQSQAVPPQYYSYELCPSPASGYVHDDRFMSMLRTELSAAGSSGTSPQAAALDTVTKAWNRVGEYTINLDLLCPTLQNFGGKGPNLYRNAKFSLLRDENKVTLPSSLDDRENFELLQPWMQKAVGDYNATTDTWEGGEASEWMNDYLDELQDLLDLYIGECQIPRFHCEVETSLTNGSYGNDIIQVMLACEQDDRWDTRPVPGYDNQTMLEIWHDAQDAYGWRVNNQYQTLAQALHDNELASSPHNQPYFAWWVGVCRRALDGAVKITCYDVIKAHPLTANALVSNYDHFNMDMGADSFAFRDLTDDTNVDPTPMWRRGDYDIGSYGMYPQLLTSSEPPLAFGMWPAFASGNFDAPSLYYGDLRVDHDGNPATPRVIDPSIDGLRQPRWYEPADALTGLPPMETWPEFHRRTHRHRLDAIMNTPTHAPDGVTPWILIPNLQVIDEDGTLNGIDETRRVLALVRSKDIREVLMFGDKPVAGNPPRGAQQDWDEFKRADAQVYSPFIKSAVLTRGSATAWDEAALNTTLRTTGLDELVIDSEYAGSPSIYDVTECVVSIDGLNGAELGYNGRLVLECKVEPVNPSEIAPNAQAWRDAIIGKISIWRPASEDWAGLDTVADADKGEYKFYVPDSSTRREWEICGPQTPDVFCQYLPEDCAGTMMIKFVHLAPATNSGFVSKYDLVQFYQIDETPLSMQSLMSGESAASQTSADFNFDGLQDSTDAEMFTAAWTNSERRADYNADGEVDALDLTQFLGALSRATSAESGGPSEE